MPGKSTHDSGQLSVGDATRTLTLPHLPYADAVHAALREVEVVPDHVETGLRTETFDGQRELFIRLEWLPGHDDLIPPGVQATGLVVHWSHLAGWSVCAGADVTVPPVDDLADPALIADAALHAAVYGLTERWVIPFEARWQYALELDIALVQFDEREAVR
ncbi:hypothetical protein OG866_26955 [Streptomyces sp. NBC_00663]|uniref:hypothetical protein n=1 Tax=Streptomyces sp. NBC_00663 TaxID=2975801 RepID=UPI002E326AF0|nr:hypothetical protein [Streptomyces sp. NBC_00663]